MGCRMAGEGARVFGFEIELDDHRITPDDRLLHDVAIAGEGSDEWSNELLAKGGLPLHEAARNLDRHVVRVERHDAVLVRPLPRGVVLVDEAFDIETSDSLVRPERGVLLIELPHLSVGSPAEIALPGVS